MDASQQPGGLDPNLVKQLDTIRQKGGTQDDLRGYIDYYQKQMGGQQQAPQPQGIDQYNSLSTFNPGITQAPTLPSGVPGAMPLNPAQASSGNAMDQAKFLAGGAYNLLPGGVQTAKDLAGGILNAASHPFKTIDNLADAGAGALDYIGGDLVQGASNLGKQFFSGDSPQQAQTSVNQQMNTAAQVGYQAQKQLSPKGFYENPTGALMILSPLLEGAGAMTGLKSLSDAGETLNPVLAAGGVAGKTLNAVKPALNAADESLLGGAGGRLAGQMSGKDFAVGARPDLTSALDQEGLKGSLSMTTDNPTAIAIAKSTKNNPFSSQYADIHAAADRTDNIMKDLTKPAILETDASVGGKIQKAVLAGKDNLETIVKNVYKVHDNKLATLGNKVLINAQEGSVSIPEGEPTLQNALQMIDDHYERIHQNSELASVKDEMQALKEIRASLVRNMGDGKNVPPRYGALNDLSRRVFNDHAPTFDPMGSHGTGKGFFAGLGEAIDNGVLTDAKYNDSGTYGAITNARSQYQNLMGQVDSRISKAVGKDITAQTPSETLKHVISEKNRDLLPSFYKNIDPKTADLMQRKFIQDLMDSSKMQSGDINHGSLLKKINDMSPELHATFSPGIQAQLERIKPLLEATAKGENMLKGSETAHAGQFIQFAQNAIAHPFITVKNLMGSAGWAKFIDSEAGMKFLTGQGQRGAGMDLLKHASELGRGAVINSLFQHPSRSQ